MQLKKTEDNIMTQRFKKLLEPGYIGKLQTRNRMIKTASASGMLDEQTATAARPSWAGMKLWPKGAWA